MLSLYILIPFSDKPDLALVSSTPMFTFTPNLTLSLSYYSRFSFAGAQASVGLWQFSGYNTAQTKALPPTMNDSWTLNSVIFPTVMVLPTIETFVWYGVLRACCFCKPINNTRLRVSPRSVPSGLDSLRTIYALQIMLLSNTSTLINTSPFSIAVPPPIASVIFLIFIKLILVFTGN